MPGLCRTATLLRCAIFSRLLAEFRLVPRTRRFGSPEPVDSGAPNPSIRRPDNKIATWLLQPCQVCSLACWGNELGRLQRCLQGCNLARACSLADLVVVVVVVCLCCHICGTCRTQLLPVDCCGLCCVGHLQCWNSGKQELQFCSSA